MTAWDRFCIRQKRLTRSVAPDNQSPKSTQKLAVTLQPGLWEECLIEQVGNAFRKSNFQIHRTLPEFKWVPFRVEQHDDNPTNTDSHDSPAKQSTPHTCRLRVTLRAFAHKQARQRRHSNKWQTMRQAGMFAIHMNTWRIFAFKTSSDQSIKMSEKTKENTKKKQFHEISLFVIEIQIGQIVEFAEWNRQAVVVNAHFTSTSIRQVRMCPLERVTSDISWLLCDSRRFEAVRLDSSLN